MDKANLFHIKETCMKVNGKMIKDTDMVKKNMKMVIFIKENGI